ncbi:chaplin [Peterkaempfera griseoplana]|uniref:chaplin n=1 Tax=Peterkaempfera griseoplana TaxID=66896 RepID=UPI0006E13D5F|nr:chaplin [Peterkaempfera griseoplana]
MITMKKAAVLAAAAGCLAASGAGTAFAQGADAEAAAVGSPGVVSGNVVQVPVSIPVNVCGNTINVIAILNPTFGNTCLNVSGNHHRHHGIGLGGGGLNGGGFRG